MSVHARKAVSQTDFQMQCQALACALKDYEASKWKVIGQKLGKPAKVRGLDVSLYYCSSPSCRLTCDDVGL